MSTRVRIGVLAAIIVVGVAAFLLLRGSNDAVTTTTQATKPVATTPAARVVRAQIVAKSSGPVGGVKTLKAFSGDRIVIAVKSVDYAGEVHLHGLDIHKDVTPGKSVVFSLSPGQTESPKVQGVVEMELESTSTQILKLEIQPS